jgi:hypothetical protein
LLRFYGKFDQRFDLAEASLSNLILPIAHLLNYT